MSLKVKIAKIISILLGPHFWAPIIVFICIFNAGLSFDQIKILLPVALILIFVIPIGYLTLMYKLGKISTWDMSKKEERPGVILVMLIPVIIAFLVIYFAGNALLFRLISMLIVFGIISLLITKFWKISLHAGINTSAIIVINYLFNWRFSLLYLLIPLVIWSRLELNKHTLMQIFAGVLISGVLTLVGLYI